MTATLPSRIGPYTIRGTIGEGAFSVVKLAFHEEQRMYYACKIVQKARLNSNNLIKRFEEEIRINQQLHHPGVVGLIDIMKDSNNYYVITEFCPNGELFQYIVDRGRLLEDEAKPKIKMILETLRYIHSLKISHRDLKPENILLDQYGQPKISDFGLSRFVGEGNLVSTPCGSPCYASPECISGLPYDGLKSDIWSCGVVLFAMVTGQLPWTKRNQNQLFEQIRKGDYIIPDGLTKPCCSLIKGLMTVDESDRISVEDALNHPWLAGVPDLPQQTVVPPHISLKSVDLFFDRDTADEEPIPLQRQNSMEGEDFDRIARIITGTFTQVRIRRRVKKHRDEKDKEDTNDKEKDGKEKETKRHHKKRIPEEPEKDEKDTEKEKPRKVKKRVKGHEEV